MKDGWIKIYRQLLSWEWFDNSKMVHIFLYFLLRANTEDKEWRGLTIHRGQFVTAVPTISAATGLSEQEIRTCVKRLVRARQIVYDSSHRATHRCVIVTICNFEKYQEFSTEPNEPINEPATNLQRTTNEPATNLQRQYKNNKNKKNNIYLSTSKEVESGTSPTFPAEANASPASDPTKEQAKNEAMPFKTIKDDWNATCTGYPKLHVLSEARKTKIRNRVAEMGGKDKALPLIHQLFEKMMSSKFLRGDNKRGWKATFDWLFENDKNWVKVYEGNYDETQDAKMTTQNFKPYTNDTTSVNPQYFDQAAARRIEFERHICQKLSTPDSPEPDLYGSY